MIHRYYIIFVSGLLFFSANAQRKIDTVFVGQVTGLTAIEFAKYGTDLTDGFGHLDLTKSKNRIEIRLYEYRLIAGLASCTVLAFDTSFKISRTIINCHLHDSLRYIQKRTINLGDKDPVDIFSKLVTSGIFSLSDEGFETYKPKELTSEGLTDADMIGVADGVSYTLEYKVDSVFNIVNFNNSGTYSKAYPDNQIFRRQTEIVRVLGSGIR